MINVTKSFIPPIQEYQQILKEAWDQEWITNRGSLVLKLEDKLKSYLGVTNVIATTNGTLPLQIAIKALELEGDIITTPFSYVATVSSIFWEGCTPVFVDIHPEYLTMDETKIEEAITPRTTAILATHVFGNPCHVKAIEDIAKSHGLKVIYDAAHCFGVKYNGQSVFNYGDVSTCSFHATKLFHTGEGGAMFTNDEKLRDILFYHHNFGHKGPEAFQGLGINAKMSELQAAMGLAVFKHIEYILASRKKVVEAYESALKDAPFSFLKLREGTRWNYSYFPVIFRSEEEMVKIQAKLNLEDIYPRRYFYPSLNTLPYLEDHECQVSDDISRRILCLPLYHDLAMNDVERIVRIVMDGL